MDKMNDAFGQEIYDFWKGVPNVREIVERNDGYILVGLQGPEHYFAEYKNWPRHQKEAIRFARGRVLDIGCGAGRCLLYLQQKGLDVVGIDTSPLAVEVCRKRGAANTHVRSITRIRSEMGIFDTIVMLGNNFGLLNNYQRARWLLRKIYKLTSNRARIIGETIDPYQTDFPEHLEYHRLNRRRGRMGGQIRLRIRYKKYKTPWFDLLLVSPEELTKIIDNTGWGVKKLVKSQGPPYCLVLEKEEH